MNCLEFRRQKLAMPKQLGKEEQQHLHECPQCAAFSKRVDEHEDELRKTVLVAVPDGLADRVLLNLVPRRKRNIRVLAFAASLLLSASLVLVYQHMIHPGLADAVIAHVLEEPYTLTATQKVPWENLANAFAGYGGTLRGSIGDVRYLGWCKIRGNLGRHIVLETQYGTASVVLLPRGNTSEIGSMLSEHGLSAVVIPAGRANMGIIADSPQNVEKVEKLLRQHLAWES